TSDSPSADPATSSGISPTRSTGCWNVLTVLSTRRGASSSLRRRIGDRSRADAAGFSGEFVMPHLVGIDLAEAVSIAVLTQPESGSRGADVDCFSGHVGGLLRGVHPSPRLGLAAILRDRDIEGGMLVPPAAPPRGNNRGHTSARGVGRGVLHRRKQFGGEVAHGGIVGGERGQPLAIRNVAVCRGEQDPAR